MKAAVLAPDILGNHGGARVIIDGRKCSMSSVRRYSEYNAVVYGRDEESVEERVERAKARGHDLFWINLESSVICGDPGFYEREAAKWAGAPRISSGDHVEFDGEVFRVEKAFNNNFKLVAVASYGDLLAALKSLVGAVESFSNADKMGWPELELARAAIAKAAA